MVGLATALFRKKSRRLFLALPIFAFLLPLFFAIFIVYQYIQPLILAGNSSVAEAYFDYSIAAILILSLTGSFLLFKWLQALVPAARNVNRRTDPGENEIRVLLDTFDYESSEHRRIKELFYNIIAMSQNLTAELDADRLFPLIISKVTKTMKAERTSLYIVDQERKEIWTKVAEGVDQIRLPLGKGISGRVAETGEIVNTKNARDLPFFIKDFDEKHNFFTRSVLCMPVTNNAGRRIAVIQVINKKDKEGFDADDEMLLKALTSQVAVALDNSLLLEEVSRTFESAVRSLAATVDARHPFTAGHSQRVTEYSLLIAKVMKLGAEETEVLKYAALLHDIGKIGISDEILLKAGIYMKSERSEMETHPVKTKSILDQIHFPLMLRDVPSIAACHHERPDGRGYPYGLTAAQIPLGAKIIAVADVFDALTSKRDYPKYSDDEILDCYPVPLPQTISILEKGIDTQFDPEAVKALLACLPKMLLLYRGSHFAPDYVDDTIHSLTA